MRITWKLRMAAAQREVWTGAQLQRLLAEKAGLELSSASVSALFTKQPNQIKLSTLIALCTALECSMRLRGVGESAWRGRQGSDGRIGPGLCGPNRIAHWPGRRCCRDSVSGR